MQRANPKSRMGVLMRGGVIVPVPMTVRVKVNMPLAVMLMLVGMDIVLECALQRPQTDADQHHPHQPLAPG